MLCPNCQAENQANARFCIQCGSKLGGAPATPPATGDETVSKVIPYKNAAALVSYYLGVFSLIPCVGVLLALASIPLGIIGLNFVKKNPQAHGTIHAWVGIILGTLVLIGHGAFFLWISRQ